jgi:hypothetical protein
MRISKCLQLFANGSHGCLRGSGHAQNLNLNQSKENQ